MDYLKIGSFLQRLRKEKGMTQAQVAELFDVSFKTISKWECGESLPEIPLLSKVAKYYGVTIDEIINGQRNDEQENVILEYKSMSNKMKVKQHQNRLTLSFAIGMSIICLSFILIFIIGYITNRSDLGSLIPLGILFIGIVTYFIGNVVVNSKQLMEFSDEDNVLIKKKKAKFNFWVILISIYIGLCCVIFNIFPRIMLDSYGDPILGSLDSRYWVINIGDFLLQVFLLAFFVGVGPFFYFYIKKGWHKPFTNFVKKYRGKLIHALVFLTIFTTNNVFIHRVIPYLGDNMPYSELYTMLYIYNNGPKTTSILLDIETIVMIITFVLFILSFWKKKIIVFELIGFSLLNMLYVMALMIFKNSSSANPYKVVYYNYPFFVSLSLIAISIVLINIMIFKKIKVRKIDR